MDSVYRYLTHDDRKKIEKMWSQNKSPREIAIAIGVTLATIYRELKRGENGRMLPDYRKAYSADQAQARFQESLRQRGTRR